MGEVDAVDKDVDYEAGMPEVSDGRGSAGWGGRTIEDLLEGTAFGGLGHVPLEDVLAVCPFGQTGDHKEHKEEDE